MRKVGERSCQKALEAYHTWRRHLLRWRPRPCGWRLMTSATRS